MRGLLLGLIAAALLVPLASAQDHGFEVTMHNDGGFYFRFDGGADKNPDVVLHAGETYTFHVRNEGTTSHDFHVGGLGATALLSPGQSETLTITVPDGPIGNYWCDPHRTAGMEGSFTVEGADSGAGSNGAPGAGLVAVLAAVALAAITSRR